MNASDFKLILRPYQKETSNKINYIYTKQDEYNRFAGVVLPTGGGKSFVAIDQIISINNEEGQSSDLDNGVINNSKIVYAAPGKEIISQVRLHILKNVILNDNVITGEKKNEIIQNLSPAQIEKMVKKAFPNLVFKCYAGIKEKDLPDEEDKRKLEKESYSKVATDSIVKESDIANASLVIIDEAHRVGATSWGPEIEAAFRKNVKGKILAITATPERNDKKGKKDMMYRIAKMVYTDHIPLPEQYMAQEIYLLDAMRDGLVTPTKIVDFPSSLAETDEYNELVELLKRFEKTEKNKKSKINEKEKVTKALEQMEEIIGYSPRNLTEEEKKQKRNEDIKKTIAQNLDNKNGKYIAFIPKRNSKENLTVEEHFESWKSKIRSQFEGIVDSINIEYVSSEKTDAQNDEILKKFEDAPNDKGGIKILMSIDKLDEGVHVDGIDGEFMYKKVNSSRLYLQESGRCISSCDPNLPSTKQSRRKIFDITGNTRGQVQKQTGKKTSHQYNLKRIREISKWINENENQYPDINKQIPEDAKDRDKVIYEKEIRYAISLKNLKSKYQLYLKEDIPIEDRTVIEEILEIAQGINLWDTVIPDRVYEPSEAQLTGSDFLSYCEREKKFMEAYHSAEYAGKYKVLNNKYRFAKIINILKILKAHKPDLELPEGIFYVNNLKPLRTKTLKQTGKIDFNKFLKANFDKTEIQYILREIQDYDALNASSIKEIYSPGEEIDLTEELAFARGYFWTSGKSYEEMGNKAFSKISVKDLINIGLIDIYSVKQHQDLYEMFGIRLMNVLDKDGYIKSKPIFDEGRDILAPGKFSVASKFQKASFTRGGAEYINGYDRYGYDEEGYDELGFDKFGYNKEKIHRDTLTKYDVRGFYWNENESKWLNRVTNTEYDSLGYNIYGKNDDGFERPKAPPEVKSLWYKRFDDGTYSDFGREFSETKKVNSFGAKKNQLMIDGFYMNGSKYDTKEPDIDDYYRNDRDINGYNREGFKLVILNGKRRYINRDTSMEFNTKGQAWDENREELRLHPKFENAQLILKKLIVENKNMNDIYSYIMQKKGLQDKNEATKFVKKVLETAVELSKSAQDFDLYTYKDSAGKEVSFFKGINKYPDKATQVEEFFKICPIAKRSLIRETKEINRRLELPKGKETLTKRQNIISRRVEELDDILYK